MNNEIMMIELVRSGRISAIIVFLLCIIGIVSTILCVRKDYRNDFKTAFTLIAVVPTIFFIIAFAINFNEHINAWFAPNIYLKLKMVELGLV